MSLLLLCILLVIPAFFNAGQFAILRLRSTKVQKLLEEGRSGSNSIIRLQKRLRRTLLIAELGITISLISIGWICKSFASKWLVNNNSINFLRYVPLPKYVLAEDEFSASIYNFAGYKNIKLMDIVPRFEKLKAIKLNPNKCYILIAPGLRDDEIVLNTLRSEFCSRPNIKYICKLHPHSKMEESDFRDIDNLSFSKKNITKLLPKASALYVTYSSVGFDAYNLGIPIKIIDIPGIISTSNIIDLLNTKVISKESI